MLLNNASLLSVLLAVSHLALTSSAAPVNSPSGDLSARWAGKIAPKVFIISMFKYEEAAWKGIKEFDIYAHNITVPGISPLFPDVHCSVDYEVCQMTTGESEINAAGSVGALSLSQIFDLRKTYFMIAGIGGVNPEQATLGSVTFARYAVQVALQYEFDSRELPSNFTTGYIPLGTDAPSDYPVNIYGTEVFEVSTTLRDIAVSFASTARLNDSTTAQAYRALYSPISSYAAGASPPSVVACDVATSDVYYSGDILAEAFGNTTHIWTNGSGVYCTTAQEDNASLSALVRSTLYGKTDFSRIIVMRTASDFDRPPPSVSPLQNLLYADQGGFEPAINNIYLAGIKVVEGILNGWQTTFEAGIKPANYIGDIFNTLGGKPDYGRPADFINPETRKRRMFRRSVRVQRDS
ncbi:hypothetical protein DV736_g5481, partial [Chaetothyriales sp. CBS 134916]